MLIPKKRFGRIHIIVLVFISFLLTWILGPPITFKNTDTHVLRNKIGLADHLKVGRVHFPFDYAFEDSPDEENTSNEYIYETRDKEEIEELVHSLELKFSIKKTHCKCLGDVFLEFYQGDELLESFSFHHDTHIRTTLFKGDRYLTDESREYVKNWLKERGFDIDS